MASKRFSSAPPDPMGSRHGERRDGAGSSNFIDVLKERVQAVLDAQHQSSRASSTGSVEQPTTSTDPVSQTPASPQSSYTTPGDPSRPELRMLPFRTGPEPVVVDSDTRVRSAKLQDYYSIDWRPKELLFKFRQQVEGFQLGANLELEGSQVNTKLVFKPVILDRKWKFICEPKYGDLRLLTKKIPLGPLFNIQVGIGHEWQTHATGWKWKVTSAFGGHTQTHIRHKTTFPVTPGFDLRVGWNAEYFLPDLHGSLGTGDPAIGLNLGHLSASVERVEAIYTHRT